MERNAWGSSTTPVRVAIEELCQLLDSIDQTTDLLERHSLFRRLSTTAKSIGVLRMGSALAQPPIRLA